MLSALVLTAFVAVLEKDVDSGAMQHQVQRSRALAEAQCESVQTADRRGGCIAMLHGDVAALEAPAPLAPDNTAYAAAYEQENLTRATTMSGCCASRAGSGVPSAVSSHTRVTRSRSLPVIVRDWRVA